MILALTMLPIDDETFELTAPRHHCVWPSLPPARSAAPASYITSRPPFLAEIRCFDEGVIIVGREGIEQWTEPIERLGGYGRLDN